MIEIDESRPFRACDRHCIPWAEAMPQSSPGRVSGNDAQQQRDFLAPFRLPAKEDSGDSSSQEEKGGGGAATRWRCPRHMIACQCSPVLDNAEQLSPIISAQWQSESDRRAVLTKLTDVGVKSVTALKRVIATPVFDAKIPAACWFRGAPCLLNELLLEKSKGSKLIKTSTLEALWARCGGSDADTREMERVLQRAGHSSDLVAEIVGILRLAGLVTLQDMRLALLLPWKQLGLRSDVRAVLEQKLGGADKIHELLCEGVSTEPLLAGITGCASDSEGDAKIARERLRACGIATVREFVMCARAQVEGAHRMESALSDAMRSRHGPEGVMSDEYVSMMLRCSTVLLADGGGVLVTAPHGIWLNRQGHPVHKPEVFTTFVASAMAQSHGWSRCMWSDEERVKNEYRSRADHENTDPNYTPGYELKMSPWFRALGRHARRFRSSPQGVLHVDLHGRRDVMSGVDQDGVEWRDECDCDIGVGAMLNMADCEVAAKIADELHWRLAAAIGDSGFRVSKTPRLTGFIGAGIPMDAPQDPQGAQGYVEGAHPFNTMTMQSTLLGLRAVQLELSLRLRRELRANGELLGAFAEAIGVTARSMH